MSKNATGYDASYGDAVLRRLGDQPASVKKAAQPFRGVQGELAAAEKNVEAKKAARDTALFELGEVDVTLDGSLEDLALALVSAKLSKRTQPFAGLSSYPPAKLERLAYQAEVTEVAKLLAKLKNRRPPAPVAKVAAKVASAAAASQKAINALKSPQSAYSSAQASRDALLPSWARSLARFKADAKSLLFDVPGAYDALFAKPGAIEAPKKRRPKKAAPPPTPPVVTPPSPTNGSGATT